MSNPKLKRILVVVNKNWETDPVVNVFFNDKAVPAGIKINNYRHPVWNGNNGTISQRVTIDGSDLRGGIYQADIWCIQDLMDKNNGGYSSSSEKDRVLRILYGTYKDSKPDYVIAMGTAAYPPADSYNGSVTIGTQVFINDIHPYGENPKSNWNHPNIGRLMPSMLTNLKDGFIQKLSYSLRYNAECRFLQTPLNPAAKPIIIAGDRYVSLGNVNITEYSDYAWADEQAVAFARSERVKDKIASMETTHGIIRLLAEDCLYGEKTPFLFISGITDRVGFFDEEVTPRVYSQNFTASHNMGITLAWLLQELPDIAREEEKEA